MEHSRISRDILFIIILCSRDEDLEIEYHVTFKQIKIRFLAENIVKINLFSVNYYNIFII